MKTLKTKRDFVWENGIATEMVEFDGRIFKLRGRITSHETEAKVYILGASGWELFLTKDEINYTKVARSVDRYISYRSPSEERKEWAKILFSVFKEDIEKIFA